MIVNSGGGDDSILTGSKDDSIFAGAGNDTISAGAGNDSVNGGSGDDWIIGGTGNDFLIGASGDDHFVFNFAPFRPESGSTGINTSDGQDVIRDFTFGVRGGEGETTTGEAVGHDWLEFKGITSAQYDQFVADGIFTLEYGNFDGFKGQDAKFSFGNGDFLVFSGANATLLPSLEALKDYIHFV